MKKEFWHKVNLTSTLLCAMPAEQVKPVFSCTASLISLTTMAPMAKFRFESSESLRRIKASDFICSPMPQSLDVGMLTIFVVCRSFDAISLTLYFIRYLKGRQMTTNDS